MSNTFARINNAAHTGALGNNRLPMPSNAQLDAGNYAKGHIRINGLDVAIENPAYTYRKSTDKTGQQWSCLMQAHYGYINGYKGNDGDNIDAFVGSIPENDTAYIINQKTQGGFFDEHKVMLGFLSQQQAVDTYQHCFERGWTGLMSVVPCTMSQLKWWLANGDKSRPVTRERLPYAGLERLDSVVWGGTDDANLYSHGGQLSKLLYQIRLDDANNQALEPLAYHDMIAELGNQGFMYENYDALIVEYNKLERKAKQLLMVMQGAADTVKPVGVTVSKPLTKNGVSNVIAWFEMDDGQAVGVFFHNPDKNPKRLDPTDEMISYKWVLNKKDITIAVAPENGKDVIIRTVAKRIMQLVEKNHDRFAKANSDKAELNQKEQSLGQLVIEKQSQLDMLNSDIEALEAKKAANVAVAGGQQDLLAGDNQNDKEDVYSKDFDAGLIAGVEKKIIAGGWLKSKESGRWFSRDMKFSLGMTNNGGRKIASYLLMLAISDDPDGVRTFTDIKGGNDELFFGKYSKNPNMTADEIYEFIASRITQAEQVVEPTTQDRPSNWRTNLANARAVAKSLGLETKGKKLERLVMDIDIFDDNEVKKELLAEFKGLASRLVLPKGYIFDLSDAEESIGDITRNTEAWIRKQGKIDTNTIRVELRTIPDSSQGIIFNSVHIYADDPKTKKEFDKFSYQRFGDIGASSPETPKEIIAKMELFLTKAILPEIEYQKMENSKTIELSELSELGIANIESIGNENIYIEKDGKFYISKVGNTENYALGEWDFAQYPDGKPATAAPVTQPEPTPVVSESEPTPAVAQPVEVQPVMPKYINPKDVFLKKANAVYQDMDEMGFNGFAKKVTAIIEDVSNNVEKVDAADKRLEGVVFESKNPLISGEWRDLATGKSYFFENMEYGEVIDTRKEGRRNVIDPWRTTDGEYFESLREAKAHELETYAKQRLIDDGFMQGVKTKDKPQPVIESPTPNPDRDYLQSIIDGEADLEAKGITAKIREIILRAKDASDTKMLELADKAAKAYAAHVKAKAAAKLAEVQ